MANLYERYGLYIDGEWRGARDGALMEVADPGKEDLREGVIRAASGKKPAPEPRVARDPGMASEKVDKGAVLVRIVTGAPAGHQK